jgi:hypothetical protein
MVRWQNFFVTIRVMATPEQRPVIDSARLFAASRRYSEILRRAIVSQSTMSSALEIPKVSGELKDMVRYEHRAGVTGLQSLLKEMMPTETVDAVRDFDKLGEFLAQQTAVNCEMIIAAAVVVLSHSTADDVFTTACELAIELEPANWIPELDMKRKVSIGRLKQKGPSGVFADELERLRRKLPRMSLARRAELFFRRVKIRHHPMFGPADVRYFRLSKLKQADDLRNSVVHGIGLPQIDLDLSASTMLFLHEAAITAMRSLATSYRLPIEWTILVGGEAEDMS